MKKQLRGNASGFCTAFPLLYSKFIRDENFRARSKRGRPNRRPRTARQSNSRTKRNHRTATSQPLAEGNAEEAGTHSWRKFLTAVRTRWLDASLVLTGLIVIALGVTLDQLQRSPWVTRQGQRPDQPIPFSHKHHVEGLGLQCQYCHTHGGEVELRGHSADQDLHQLPCADLDERGAAGAGARRAGRRGSRSSGSGCMTFRTTFTSITRST